MTELLDLPPANLAFCAAAVFGAGLVRGYSGFGMSALIMSSLALVLPPAEIVPITLLLEIAATLLLWRGIRADIVWPLMTWLMIGTVISLPVGVLALAHLPADLMRVVIALLVLTTSLLLWRGIGSHPRLQRNSAVFTTGVLAGLIGGAAAVGGLPVMLYMIAANLKAAAARATIMVVLLLFCVYGTAVLYLNGLLDQTAGLRTVVLALPTLAGVLIGHRHFQSSAPESFRRFALILLIALSLLGLARALFA